MRSKKIKIAPNVTYAKQKIPLALREQVWIKIMGRIFEGKCPTKWCANIITVFNFESGHNIPESKGGATVLENLVPLCTRCNRSMGNQYSFEEWSKQFTAEPSKPKWMRFFLCFASQ